MNPVAGSTLYQGRASELSGAARDLPLSHASVRAAFEARELEIAYQPILRANDLAPVACEALLRWHHPTRGLQHPAQFIPILERSSLSLDVGDWLLETAARQMLEWQAAGIPAMRLAVNVASWQIHAADFASRTQRVLESLDLPASRLTLEISQDVLLDRPHLALSTFGELLALGIGVEVDDFGGGPSAVTRLARASMAGFKLDRRFLDGLSPDNPGAIEELRLLAQLARDLGLRCTAEGVQTDAELAALRAIGITEVQGHLFCAAMSPETLTDYLHSPTNTGQDRATS
ncbi:EAL domain-containing protein (putative c-di-GMP-specific phosphodiesterase class I) [Panacagrimonas perspica]|uniref:EAL domain-containing protein (Putative c-di-GMP-specific phosphodiesterase class I) n=1 Tax=Panacagrimonas perspica TaxID=381431 RepID=A0A4R7PA60_9GAMM|nr:EAL domain-containing protein [Panacagrimonas perspica]TDU30914.1 EAL domain-containing protein (putative c-di-GMP-specific phosphodiesterase class I) [Panacagrimonas perspica]THD01932.1 hypothetical protein B1810_18215 [Panacagrimonas perspica]